MKFIIDATNYCYALFAGSNGRADVGQSLLSLAEQFRKHHHAQAIAVFDGEGPTWRHELYPAYKAGRSAKPQGLHEALAKARDLCDREDLLGPEVEGFEADDVIATLTQQAVGRGESVVICSRDKDLRQCLQAGKVSLLSRATRVERKWRFEYLTAATLIRETGLSPAQWPDFRALSGDPSDAWPGAPGIGEGIATRLVIGAGSLANVMGNLWALKLSDRQRDALFHFDWKLGLELMTLRRNVPLYEGSSHARAS